MQSLHPTPYLTLTWIKNFRIHENEIPSGKCSLRFLYGLYNFFSSIVGHTSRVDRLINLEKWHPLNPKTTLKRTLRSGRSKSMYILGYSFFLWFSTYCRTILVLLFKVYLLTLYSRLIKGLVLVYSVIALEWCTCFNFCVY